MTGEYAKRTPIEILDLDSLTPAYAVELDVVAQQTRHDFNALVEAVSRPHFKSVDWTVSSIASRNCFQSPLFVRCCQLRFLKRRVEQTTQHLQIRTSDRPMADLLSQCFFSDPRVTIRCTESFTQRLWRLSRPARQLLIALLTFAMRWLARSVPPSLPRDPIVLVDTFVLNNGGMAGGIQGEAYHDRYYSGLVDHLTADERKTIYFLPTLVGFVNPRTTLRQLRQSPTRFLIPDDYLRLSDFWQACTSGVRLLRLDLPRVEFDQLDITPLLHSERRTHCCDVNSLQGFLYYRFAFRLAQAGIQVRLLIDWYENQVIDRALIRGFREFHPTSKLTGYQGFILPRDLQVYLSPNEADYESGVVPDLLLVTGRALKETVCEFTNRVRVGTAPGFRFQRLWRARVATPSLDHYTILVALPIDLAMSRRMLEMLASDSRIGSDARLRIKIKPHPTYHLDRVRGLLNPSPAGWQFVSGDFHDQLETANLLISAISSACLEALAKGVPVIVIPAAGGITERPIPSSVDSRMWADCRTAKDMQEAIVRFQRCDRQLRSQYREWGQQIREDYFAPVNRQNVLRFLDLPADERGVA